MISFKKGGEGGVKLTSALNCILPLMYIRKFSVNYMYKDFWTLIQMKTHTLISIDTLSIKFNVHVRIFLITFYIKIL